MSVGDVRHVVDARAHTTESVRRHLVLQRPHAPPPGATGATRCSRLLDTGVQRKARAAMPPAIQPLTTADVRSAVKSSKEADFLVGWLEERGDAALFVGRVTKVANNKPRLLVITSYRAAVFGFSQFQTRKSYEFELLQLLAIQVDRNRHCHRHRHRHRRHRHRQQQQQPWPPPSALSPLPG